MTFLPRTSSPHGVMNFFSSFPPAFEEEIFLLQEPFFFFPPFVPCSALRIFLLNVTNRPWASFLPLSSRAPAGPPSSIPFHKLKLLFLPTRRSTLPSSRSPNPAIWHSFFLVPNSVLLGSPYWVFLGPPIKDSSSGFLSFFGPFPPLLLFTKVFEESSFPPLVLGKVAFLSPRWSRFNPPPTRVKDTPPSFSKVPLTPLCVDFLVELIPFSYNTTRSPPPAVSRRALFLAFLPARLPSRSGFKPNRFFFGTKEEGCQEN